MLRKILKKVFGDADKKYLQKIGSLVVATNSLEEEIEQLSKQQIQAKTEEFKQKLKNIKTDISDPQLTSIASAKYLIEILPQAFALVREVAKRQLNQRHYDVQLMAGIALFQGKVIEMRTGEGKTLAATLPVYLNALTSNGVHIITVNDYLARRDAVWMGQIYDYLGLSVGCISHQASYLYDPSLPPQIESKTNNKENRGKEKKDVSNDQLASFRVTQSYLKPIDRQTAYRADITYGPNNEFGFDFLRDNLVYDVKQVAQRELSYAVIDEVDSILIDEARTPLIISAPDTKAKEKYQQANRLVLRLKLDIDYQVDEKMRSVFLTETGINTVEKILGFDNLYEQEGTKEIHYLEAALKAQALFKKDKHYVVKEGQIVIVDEFTGRLMPGRRISDGIHQALEAKEGVIVQKESKTIASITFQNYFKMYQKLAGMTGTAKTSEEEFYKVYGVETVVIPTNEPMIRDDLPDKVYATEEGKFKALIEEVKKLNQIGQPVLIGTVSIERNEYLGKLLSRQGIKHQILNAKNHEQEGDIIAQAGRKEAVTVATNMAGRGVDIVLGGNPFNQEKADQVKELGGLFVIGTERHEARRIDNQLRGRAGRQGNIGYSQFYISLDDDLIRVFGAERVVHIKNLIKKMGITETQALENNLVSNAIEKAQKQIEGFHFDVRKNVLEYDNVVNKHRQVINKMRRQFLSQTESKDKMLTMITQEINKVVTSLFLINNSQKLAPSQGQSAEDLEAMVTKIGAIFLLEPEIKFKLLELVKEKDSFTRQLDIVNYLTEIVTDKYNQKKDELGALVLREMEKFVALQTIDLFWVEHLEAMDYLRDSVGLRAHGQRNPLMEYKAEGHKLFHQVIPKIESRIVQLIFRVKVVPQSLKSTRVRTQNRLEDHSSRNTNSQSSLNSVKSLSSSQSQVVPKKIGRNNPCPCGAKKPNGQAKKYKHCCGKLIDN